MHYRVSSLMVRGHLLIEKRFLPLAWVGLCSAGSAWVGRGGVALYEEEGEVLMGAAMVVSLRKEFVFHNLCSSRIK